jgi:hypothetical protein
MIKIYKKSNCQLLYTLIDDDIKLTRLPVTCIKFYNPPNHENLDHYQILIATCNFQLFQMFIKILK